MNFNEILGENVIYDIKSDKKIGLTLSLESIFLKYILWLNA